MAAEDIREMRAEERKVEEAVSEEDFLSAEEILLLTAIQYGFYSLAQLGRLAQVSHAIHNQVIAKLSSKEYAKKIFDELVFSITQPNKTFQILDAYQAGYFGNIVANLDRVKGFIWRALTTSNILELDAEEFELVLGLVRKGIFLHNEKYNAIRKDLIRSLECTYEHIKLGAGYLISGCYVNLSGLDLSQVEMLRDRDRDILYVQSMALPDIASRMDFLTYTSDFSRVNFSDVNFENHDFRQWTLDLTRFNGANCSRANFMSASLEGTDFRESNLLLANMRCAHLTRATLAGAYLHSASLIGATLMGADLTNANFMEAKLIDVDFTDAVLFGARFEDAIFFEPSTRVKNMSFNELDCVRKNHLEKLQILLTALVKTSSVKGLLDVWNSVNNKENVLTYGEINIFKPSIESKFYEVIALFVDALKQIQRTRRVNADDYDALRKSLWDRIKDEKPLLIGTDRWEALENSLKEMSRVIRTPAQLLSTVQSPINQYARQHPALLMISDPHSKGKEEEVEIESDDDVALPMPKRHG